MNIQPPLPYFPKYNFSHTSRNDKTANLYLECKVRFIRNGIWFEMECRDSQDYSKNNDIEISKIHRNFVDYCQEVIALHNPKEGRKPLRPSKLQISEDERILTELQTA